MLSQYRIVPISEFRKQTTRHVAWVQSAGGRVWVTRHGAMVAALVPMPQCELLETWESRSLAEERRRMARLYARWKAVKAVSAGGDPDATRAFDFDQFGYEVGSKNWP